MLNCWAIKLATDLARAIFISPQATPSTVAHELGYVLTGMRHHENEDDYLPYELFPSGFVQEFQVIENFQVITVRRLPKTIIDIARANPILTNE